MNKRALQIASFLSLSALIFLALDLTAGAGQRDELAMHFSHQPTAAPYLCVAKVKVKRVV
ncbi:hypothetical protein [Pseudomonas sp. dw_358]|uniref:hypothetical protein n=1 Tax=Pseudomonas sp. dw_358 TaxID=2720083 RepID=UPI001BD301F0|nr:hypothetical protein [Pseudomonas sp. dw_358]